ncbi:MAG: hypothetical protein WBW93_05960 [Steroidobacteraceae bacterium]
MTQRLMALKRTPGTADKQPEPLIETVADLPKAHSAHPRSGEFDRERNTIKPAADLPHRLPVLSDLEIRRHGAGTLHEELDSGRGDSSAEAERRHRPDLLAGDHKRLSACGEQCDLRATRQDCVGKRSDCVDEVFAVIEDQQQATSGQ